MNTKEDIEIQNKIANIARNSIKINEYISPKTTTGDVIIKLNENSKSILEIGNIKVYNIKKFNWINRIMFKLLFGIKIKNIKDEAQIDYVKNKT